ncbi:hypothetical protein AA0111_g1424 [Alternaria arborescens]|uniref:hypothetical protein n=1 Tax=Alternaria arborescens TaxID=156630 RepID=UPI0010750684|nr:hypothetical protein AA0111_g1424 [Alternaria arborescens]RYO41193.1 hypothetical protein AA0111_g1424 [Alternaria arborescens]
MNASASSINPSQLPFDRNITFHESLFFHNHGRSRTLPSPEKVREIAKATNKNAWLRSRPPPVICEDLGLLVKYGEEITIAEGQCLLALRQLLPDTVPAPEVYGWREDDGQVFIYMELVNGITLEKSWDNTNKEDRIAVCHQLRRMVDAWRNLKQDVKSPFVGHIGGQPLSDVIFDSSFVKPPGPFPNVSAFHDYFSQLILV